MTEKIVFVWCLGFIRGGWLGFFITFMQEEKNIFKNQFKRKERKDITLWLFSEARVANNRQFSEEWKSVLRSMYFPTVDNFTYEWSRLFFKHHNQFSQSAENTAQNHMGEPEA